MNKIIIILFVIGMLLSMLAYILSTKELQVIAGSLANLIMYFTAGIAYGKALVEEML